MQPQPQLTLDVIYENWRGYHQKLRACIAPLTSEQLVLQPAAHMWPLGQIVQHIISVRAGWFSGTLQDDDEAMNAYMVWGQRDSPNFQPSIRKELTDQHYGHTAHVWVARIVDDEVVPEDAATRTYPSPHDVGKALLKPSIQQRREDGGLKHDVLAPRFDGFRQCRRVAVHDANCCGQHFPGPLGGRFQQLDAL